jgi:hypothetical protein
MQGDRCRAAQSACVVGDRIVWNGAPPPDAAALAPNLLRLAEAAGLALVEVAVAPVRRGRAIVLVEPLVRLDRFLAQARERILDSLVGLLTDEPTGVRKAEEATP